MIFREDAGDQFPIARLCGTLDERSQSHTAGATPSPLSRDVY